jgi:hypothetical protein
MDASWGQQGYIRKAAWRHQGSIVEATWWRYRVVIMEVSGRCHGGNMETSLKLLSGVVKGSLCGYIALIIYMKS